MAIPREALACPGYSTQTKVRPENRREYGVLVRHVQYKWYVPGTLGSPFLSIQTGGAKQLWVHALDRLLAAGIQGGRHRERMALHRCTSCIEQHESRSSTSFWRWRHHCCVSESSRLLHEVASENWNGWGIWNCLTDIFQGPPLNVISLLEERAHALLVIV